MTALSPKPEIKLCPSCRLHWKEYQAITRGKEYREAKARMASFRLAELRPGLYLLDRVKAGRIGAKALWSKYTETERKAAMLRARARIPGKGGEKARAQLADMGIIIEPKPAIPRPE